jgi:trans-aconitate methyltransferase
VSSEWRKVWERQGLEAGGANRDPVLSDLILADGFNTGFGDLTIEAWSGFVTRICNSMRLVAGDSLFDVGCGSGAFLYLPYLNGVTVGGVDYATSQIARAQRAMPKGTFAVGEAVTVDTSNRFDVVMSCAVFLYFDSLDYAREVIQRMRRKAIRAVAILDIPDAATAETALAHRQEVLGGPEAYSRRYAGLDHQVYDRDWFAEIMQDAGLVDIRVESQDIAGYENGRFRFNAFGWLPH